MADGIPALGACSIKATKTASKTGAVQTARPVSAWEEYHEAKEAGKTTFKDLRGYTDKSEQKRVKDAILKLNPRTVNGFISGYNDRADRTIGADTVIKQLGSEYCFPEKKDLVRHLAKTYCTNLENGSLNDRTEKKINGIKTILAKKELSSKDIDKLDYIIEDKDIDKIFNKLLSGKK